MGATIDRLCVGLAVILSASAVSAQTPEDPGDEHLARALEARLGEVLDRSASLAAERALALLEGREAERLADADHAVERALITLEAPELERLEQPARSTGGAVEETLGSAPARDLPRDRLVAHEPSP